jgi:CheY-like chemotaxis protein
MAPLVTSLSGQSRLIKNCLHDDGTGALPVEPSRQRILVMEDLQAHRDEIKTALILETRGYEVFFASNLDEVERLTGEYEILNYVFDINCGAGREQEGITAAEYIKNRINNNTFVAIFTAAPNPYFKRMALRVGVDAYEEKSGNLHLKFRQIILKMLNHHISATNAPALQQSLSLQILQLQAKEASRDEMGYSYVGTTFAKDIENYQPNIAVAESPSLEANESQFQQLLTDPAWVRQNLGKYVAFADGELLRTSRDDTSIARDELLLWLTNSKEYASSNRFFARVENETRSSNLESIDEPSSFLFDGFSF